MRQTKSLIYQTGTMCTLFHIQAIRYEWAGDEDDLHNGMILLLLIYLQ